MLETPLEFIGTWNYWAKIIALASFAISVFFYLKYYLKLLMIKDPKTKYDLINEKEISALRGGAVFLVVALAFFANSFL